MLNKEIQQIRINMIEVLLEACKDNPASMYERTKEYLINLKNSIEQNKEFYEQVYKR